MLSEVRRSHCGARYIIKRTSLKFNNKHSVKLTCIFSSGVLVELRDTIAPSTKTLLTSMASIQNVMITSQPTNIHSNTIVINTSLSLVLG